MGRSGTTAGPVGRLGRRWTAAAATLAALTALGACTSQPGATKAGSSGSAPAGSSAAPSSTASSSSAKPAAAAAVISVNPASRSEHISPSKPVEVSIAHGTLTSVKLTNPAGKVVSGAMSSDGTSWRSTEDLGYSKTYRLTATGKNSDNVVVTKSAALDTVDPNNQTAVYLNRTGDYPLTDGATYGVAILPEMRFDEQIVSKADKLAAEKAITVTTSPHVDGKWAWGDNSRMYYRPQSYWPSGTKVTINAKIYGVKLGDGLYGQSDKSLHFTVGRKQVTIADDNAPKSVNKVRVYNAAGKVIRTMNTSMGQHGGTTVPGTGYINFYTLDGTYTVLEHDNPAYMSSDSYGLPSSNPQGYAKEPIYWSTKISVDGIYLHELNSTEYAQNNGMDVSHGCLNLVTANAKWFYNHSMVGDPVVVNGNKNAPKIQVWQGGGWSVPWSAWSTGNISKY